MSSPTDRAPAEPTFQRLPPHTEVGRQILKEAQEAARAKQPVCLVQTDYSGLEMRIMAQVCAEYQSMFGIDPKT